jgi:hypothetical protein
VAAGAERRDSGVAGRGQRVVEAEREHEVAEMVGRELELPAVRRQLERGQRHHAGVVGEDVERLGPVVRESGDRGRIGEI